MSERRTFAQWQPIYADYNIPTFPLKDNDKTPAVKHWQRIGINGSAELAAKFQQAEVFGFNCGPRKASEIWPGNFRRNRGEI
jgi:hypothetical protein